MKLLSILWRGKWWENLFVRYKFIYIYVYVFVWVYILFLFFWLVYSVYIFIIVIYYFFCFWKCKNVGCFFFVVIMLFLYWDVKKNYNEVEYSVFIKLIYFFDLLVLSCCFYFGWYGYWCRGSSFIYYEGCLGDWLGEKEYLLCFYC